MVAKDERARGCVSVIVVGKRVSRSQATSVEDDGSQGFRSATPNNYDRLSYSSVWVWSEYTWAVRIAAAFMLACFLSSWKCIMRGSRRGPESNKHSACS